MKPRPQTVTMLIKGAVALAVVAALFFAARAALRTQDGNLEVEVDAQTKKAVLKVQGGKDVPLPDVLNTFLARDPDFTKAVLCTWGKPHGILDAHDMDALREFGLIASTDFWGLWRTLKEKHCTGRNVPYLQQLADYAKAAAPLEKRHVFLTWHTATEVPGNALLFPQGETWYAERLNKECDIVVANSDSHFQIVVYGPTKLTTNDRIQVSEGTFVRILAQANGATIIPVLHSPEWKAYTDKGKVEVDLLC